MYASSLSQPNHTKFLWHLKPTLGYCNRMSSGTRPPEDGIVVAEKLLTGYKATIQSIYFNSTKLQSHRSVVTVFIHHLVNHVFLKHNCKKKDNSNSQLNQRATTVHALK